jgi:hypothetical protein
MTDELIYNTTATARITDPSRKTHMSLDLTTP